MLWLVIYFDVAIDLNGWTACNFLLGFQARIAPVQVNYLGYFATTGLYTMDYWLETQICFRNKLRNTTLNKFIDCLLFYFLATHRRSTRRA